MDKTEKLVDAAEPEDIRSKLLETGWQQKRMMSGDFMFWTQNYKRVGITRKTIGDLLASISSKYAEHDPETGKKKRKKSFGQQLEEMLDWYDVYILLLEGSWRRVSSTDSIVSGRGVEHYTWDMVWDFLRTWQDRGFTLELTVNEGHTVQRLNRLYAYYQKSCHTGAARPLVGDNRVLAFPAGCRGKTAQKVLGQFGSLRNVANATISQLEGVDSVGPKKAEQIVLHFAGRGEQT